MTDNLTLPTTGPYGSAIAWASSDPAVDQHHRRRHPPGPRRTRRGHPDRHRDPRRRRPRRKHVHATVLPDEDDQAKADAAAAALDARARRRRARQPHAADDGLDGATVTWASSDPAIVATDGVVDRPAPAPATRASTLTATVTVGDGHRDPRVRRSRCATQPAPAPYAGYAFSYFTGEGTIDRRADLLRRQPRQRRPAAGTSSTAASPSLESTLGEHGRARPVPHPLARGRQVLPDRHRPVDQPQRRLGRAQRTGSRYIEVWESTDLMNWSEQRHVQVSPTPPATPGRPRPTGTRSSAAVRRLLGVEALRRERPRPHRQHLQPDALRDDARLRDLQRAEGLAGPGLLAHRLDGHQGRTAPTTASPRTRAPAAPAAPTSSRRRRRR